MIIRSFDGNNCGKNLIRDMCVTAFFFVKSNMCGALFVDLNVATSLLLCDTTLLGTD